MNYQYRDLRDCNDAGTTKVERKIGIGLCYEDILWFKDTVDLSITTYDPDGASINREDVESNLPFKQTDGTQIEMTKTIEVKAEYNSRYLQYISSMWASERPSGRNGQGIIDYSNGGFWFEETITTTNPDGSEFIMRIVFPNLKVSEFPTPFSGIHNTDTVYNQEFLVEEAMMYYFDGNAPEGYATPDGYTPVSITHDEIVLTDTELTIPALLFTDTDMLTDISITNKVVVEVYNADNTDEELIVTENFTGDGTDAIITHDFSSYTNVRVQIRYQQSANTMIPYEAHEFTKGGATTPATGSMTVGTSTVDTIPFDYDYASNDDDIAQSKIEIAESSAPETIIDTLTPLTDGTGTSASFTTLTANTEYIVTMYQDTTDLDTFTISTTAIII